MADITIPKDDFVKEHKRLLKVLRSPSRRDDQAEYREQSQELGNILKQAARRLRALS